MMSLTDTHCHIHFKDYGLSPEKVIEDAKNEGVDTLILVGCTIEDSILGVEFAQGHSGCFSSVGLHPHEGQTYAKDKATISKLRELAGHPKVVAIGECGLDYYYQNAPKEDQKWLFRRQLDIAQELDLPLIFHVREAFDDFFEILDEYEDIRGVVHSFTAYQAVLDEIVKRGLLVGLNGIMTFTKDQKQLQSAKKVPIENLLLETDAPFLTPKPFRGKICEPKHVRVTAEFLSNLRGEKLEDIAQATTDNAKKLFGY